MSGESGSGKTESAKYCLQYLSAAATATSPFPSSTRALEERLMACHPLLESFGHAKTAANKNSSRFGKWVDLRYTRTASAGALRLESVFWSHLLLEKSRVASQSAGERNFHIFYQLCAHGSTHDLLPASEYAYLSHSAGAFEGIDDEEAWYNTQSAFEALASSLCCFISNFTHRTR